MKAENKKILDVMKFRHACKKFDPTKRVSDEDFETILEAGRLAPTSFGMEPFKILVVESQDLKDKLYPVSWGAQRSIEGASHLVIFLARKRADLVADGEYITHMLKDVHQIPEEAREMRRSIYRQYSEKDFGFIHFEDASLEWSRKQAYIVMANMLTAAAYLGIDSCPIEGFDYAKVADILEEAGVLDPKHFGVAVMVSFGYRGEEPRHEKTRRPMSEIVERI